ncbi:hypothetical protein ACS0TY_019865 [Phlomoides rotata]
METKSFHLVACTLLLFLLNSTFLHAHPHNQSFIDFLKPLIGTHQGNTTKGLSQLKHYLSNLGYMSNSNTLNDDTFDDTLEQAIKKYQNFFKLPETGTLDTNTIALMSQPRCGVPDFPRNHSADPKS